MFFAIISTQVILAMLHATASSPVNASLKTVWSLLLDKVENPGRYIKAVKGSKVLTRYDDGILREMKTDKMTVKERISIDEQAREVKFTLVDHPLFTGETINKIVPPPSNRPEEPLTVTFVLQWEPRTEESEKIITQEEINQVIHHAVLDLKSIAEQQDAQK